MDIAKRRQWSQRSHLSKSVNNEVKISNQSRRLSALAQNFAQEENFNEKSPEQKQRKCASELVEEESQTNKLFGEGFEGSGRE